MEGDVVESDADYSGRVQCDGEPTEEDGQHWNQVQHWNGQGGGEIRCTCGGVCDTVEQVEAAVKQRALLTPKHLEMALAPTRTLLEGLPGDIRSFTDHEVLLHAMIQLVMVGKHDFWGLVRCICLPCLR